MKIPAPLYNFQLLFFRERTHSYLRIEEIGSEHLEEAAIEMMEPEWECIGCIRTSYKNKTI